MSLWVAFTLAASLMQTLRFVLQKLLKAGGLSSAGATFARFLFAAPLAVGIAGGVAWTTGLVPPVPGLPFWGYILLGGVAQIVATDLTVKLFGMRNFAVGVAFTKTEIAQVAVMSALLLGEHVSGAGWIAIAVGLAGVMLISRSPEPDAPLFGRTAMYGLLAGGLFGLASVGYRGATLMLEPAPFFLRASVALAAATVVQSGVMAVWLRVREPGEIGRVLGRWRQTALVGLTGMLGSLGWFAAFSLQNAAYVRALGQVEMVLTLLASVLLFKERLHLREGAGIALVVCSLLLLVLTAI
jgi:drug/metabolite transporter (DMT)-like permease